ncbi:hypothetical protein MF1_07860 [Bartonella quintana]|uniref:glycoside hydrolase family 3 N-terminal domain-containing protein n=1 Tax=Bartonella quintana TaxID=803 RepID=UPI0013197DF3|nr:glycoside hydrolase family 3 N-terminal domain-containing protein [Bartonella quintana]BBL53528.1 hypothetical protein MF1_07860 [Bartonella quintana]
MTAHIVYKAVDERVPVTLSKRVIENVIRENISFDGFLMADDVVNESSFREYAFRKFFRFNT